MRPRLSICMAYYDNPRMLVRHLDAFSALSDVLRREFEYLVCDDGSQRVAAEAQPEGLNFKLFRIHVDVRWNQDAARNICAKYASADWLLLTDMDHFIPESTLSIVLAAMDHKELDARVAYRFKRATALDETFEHVVEYKPHPNSWLMHRSLYEAIGGYDERLAGYYGTDADFRDGVNKYSREVRFINAPLIRVPRDVVPDASTTTYERKAAIDRKLGELRAQRAPGSRPIRFRFPYSKVFECSI